MSGSDSAMSDGTLKRQALAAATVALTSQGLNHGSTGNISLRHGDGLLITPTGATAETITPGDIVEIDLNGKVKGDGIASSEWSIHAALLASRMDLHAVVHCHADASTALSCLRRPLPAFHYMIAGFGGDNVRCSDYAPFSSEDLAHAVVAAMAGRSACLLANHGLVVAGRSLDHALQLAQKLETLARQYILACQAGDPILLSDTELAEVHKRYASYGTAAMPR